MLNSLTVLKKIQLFSRKPLDVLYTTFDNSSLLFDGPTLFVAYYASAEIGCHLALDWALPSNILDLFCEFRNITNGLDTPCGSGLLGALSYFGLSAIDAADKDNMRTLALRGGPYTEAEQIALLNYCETDVDSLERLLSAMLPKIDLPRALLRGRYMIAAAKIEFNGIPIDEDTLQSLRECWPEIQDALIAEVDKDYGVYEGRSFKAIKFAAWLVCNKIPWPQLPSGNLDLADDTFKDMSRVYPQVAPLRELRVSLSQMRLEELASGPDGRNRCLLSAVRSWTGRNQPSNKKFIFGPAVWLRSLIKPKNGFAIAYIDWSQQEFGIAAALSGDPLMLGAYHSGDPYLAFAKQAGAVPQDATKSSHKIEREQFKQCVLAVQYGMGAESLAQRIGQPVIRARELLKLHQETYQVFWRWSDAVLDYAMLYNKLWTVFGWTINFKENPNPRFIRNFLMQGNGAEMLRLACSLATEAGIKVCAPIHDALLVEAPIDEIDLVVEQTKSIMSEASSLILNGFELASDVEIIRFPERYSDERGKKMWGIVMSLIDQIVAARKSESSGNEKQATIMRGSL